MDLEKIDTTYELYDQVYFYLNQKTTENIKLYRQGLNNKKTKSEDSLAIDLIELMHKYYNKGFLLILDNVNISKIGEIQFKNVLNLLIKEHKTLKILFSSS